MTASPNPARSMTALYANSRGGPETLHIGQVPIPSPAENEVLVAVHAAAITFAELTWEETWARRPVIPSHEISGVVSHAGSAADWTPGEEVYGLLRFDRPGGAAEYVTAPAADVARKPLNSTHVVAASVPLSGLTALQALVDHAHLTDGDQVLVHGGAGGVGGFAVQLAALLGAEVSTTARRRDTEHLKRLGAAHVIDFERENFDDQPARFDVVIDTISGDILNRSYSVLRRGGRLITLAGPPDHARAAEYGIDAKFFIVTPNRGQLDELGRFIDAGELEVPIAGTYPLADGAAAYSSGRDTERPPGKTVLIIRPE